MKSRHVVFLFFWVGLVWTTPAQADAVTYWNEVTAQAVTAERPVGAWLSGCRARAGGGPRRYPGH